MFAICCLALRPNDIQTTNEVAMEIDVETVDKWLQTGIDSKGCPLALVDCREQSEWDIARIEEQS